MCISARFSKLLFKFNDGCTLIRTSRSHLPRFDPVSAIRWPSQSGLGYDETEDGMAWICKKKTTSPASSSEICSFITWSPMLVLYVQNGLAGNAMQLFQ